MTWKPFYRLSVSPRGIFQLNRKNTFKEHLFRLKLVQDKKTDKWISDAEWTPLTGLKADTPEALLIKIATLIAPEGSIKIEEGGQQLRIGREQQE